MYATGAGHTDQGKKRDNNEDCFLVDDALGLYVVSDGMGGHAAGEVASQTAVAAVGRFIAERKDLLDRARAGAVDRAELATLAEQAVQHAAGEIYELATSSPERSGMGCTITAAINAGTDVVLAHVGDSRLYRCRNGGASQLSVDHSMAHELVLAGVLEPEEEHDHPYSHVLTRSVGTQPAVKVDTLVFDVLAGDRLVLCSDGLGDYVPDTAWLARQVPADTDVEQAAEELVSYANQAGGKDNITVVVVRFDVAARDEAALESHETEVRAKVDALASVFLFEDLPQSMALRVLEHCELESYGSDTVVADQGSVCTGLLVVVEGELELLRDEVVMDTLKPGDSVGMTTLLSARPARATLRTRGDSKVLRLDRDAFWSLVRERPWLGIGLFERLGKRLSRSLDEVIEQRQDSDLPRLPGARF